MCLTTRKHSCQFRRCEGRSFPVGASPFAEVAIPAVSLSLLPMHGLSQKVDTPQGLWVNGSSSGKHAVAVAVAPAVTAKNGACAWVQVVSVCRPARRNVSEPIDCGEASTGSAVAVGEPGTWCKAAGKKYALVYRCSGQVCIFSSLCIPVRRSANRIPQPAAATASTSNSGNSRYQGCQPAVVGGRPACV